MFRTSNPVLSRNDAFAPAGWGGVSAEAPFVRAGAAANQKSDVMTIKGTAGKTAILLGACIAAAVGSWDLAVKNQGLAMPFLLGGMLGGLVLALIITFKPRSAPVLAPIYAVAEGAFLGVLSLIVAQQIVQRTGDAGAGLSLVFQAVLLTFGILGALLVGYAAGFIRIRGVVAKCVIVGTMGVMLTYAASFLMSMFGFGSIGFIHSNGPIGIGFSLLVIVLASANLVLDFQFIEDGVNNGAPKHMEWFGAFGLMVTLVWLYIEILRLLSKLKRE